MKHGLPETMEENYAIRLKRIDRAERALKNCYEFNDCWVTSEINRALGCLNIARVTIEADKKKRELVRGGKNE